MQEFNKISDWWFLDYCVSFYSSESLNVNTTCSSNK